MLCLFFSLNLHRSSPPGQIMQAGNLIMADTSLAESGGISFLQPCGGRWGQPKRRVRSTLSHTAEVKELHKGILKPKQVNKKVKAVRLQGPVWGCFVCGTGSLCKANKPGAGNTRPDPGTATSCHTFHTPTIKIPERIRPQHYIQSYTLSCLFPPVYPPQPWLIAWPQPRSHSVLTILRDRSDISWVTATTPEQRLTAKSLPEKGQPIRDKHLGVDVTVNHTGSQAETTVWTVIVLTDRIVSILFIE